MWHDRLRVDWRRLPRKVQILWCIRSDVWLIRSVICRTAFGNCPPMLIARNACEALTDMHDEACGTRSD